MIKITSPQHNRKSAAVSLPPPPLLTHFTTTFTAPAVFSMECACEMENRWSSWYQESVIPYYAQQGVLTCLIENPLRAYAQLKKLWSTNYIWCTIRISTRSISDRECNFLSPAIMDALLLFLFIVNFFVLILNEWRRCGIGQCVVLILVLFLSWQYEGASFVYTSLCSPASQHCNRYFENL